MIARNNATAPINQFYNWFTERENNFSITFTVYQPTRYDHHLLLINNQSTPCFGHTRDTHLNTLSPNLVDAFDHSDNNKKCSDQYSSKQCDDIQKKTAEKNCKG